MGPVRVLLRYSASSVVATAISQLAFLACYWIGTSATAASVIAFAAGAVPNYLLNRRWAWGRTGPAHPTRELLPYVLITIGSAFVITFLTTVADDWIRTMIDAHSLRTVLAGGAYLAANGFTFILKFVLFDRYVFATPAADVEVRTPATR
ncbi:putative flippase GtrA [Kribbella voronezhensis]|uniref:Putative flippase GtrA n=1 Tax=Kribbella voronezhensis TaxID=2512212 RepID=A0A4R7TCY2_9ACTN|nr:putative flippase GtrA [Kribbella voronezhensis]